MIYSLLPEFLRTQLDCLPTPFFLYNLDIIQSKFSLIKKCLNPDQIYYAVKCNSLPFVIKTLAQSGALFEINNLSEMLKVAELSSNLDKCINSSPLTSAPDVAGMYAKGIKHFVFDSKSHVDNLAHNAPGACIYLRLFSTNQGSRFELSKRLGAKLNDGVELLKYAENSGLKPSGLTFHVGSQCTNHENWTQGLKVCGELFKQFKSLKVINIGGGFPVTYNRKNIPDIEDIALTINNALSTYFDSKPVLWVEPGRFLVGDSALTGTSIIQVEHKKPLSRAIVDISVFSGLIEILENGDGFGYSIETNSNADTCLYRISGPTCAGTDVIADEISLPKLYVDYQKPENSSRLYLLNTGAYTLDYIGLNHKSGFNGSKIPHIYFMKNKRIIKNGENNY